jgi:putative membrane protein
MTMLIVAQLAAVVASALHVLFFVLESLLWSKPDIHRRFGVGSPSEAAVVRPMAYNQGFYNLALALGVLAGVVLTSADGDSRIVGRTLIVFGAGCMAFAGVILATTGRRFLPAAAIQFLPAGAAVVLASIAG